MDQKKILIVEDEPLVAEDIAGHVESIGYQVAEIVHSGEEAITFMKEQSPDAAILDITLSGQIDGIEVAKFINENKSIPIIYLTSHADRNTLERVKETRPGAYLVKPFDEQDLLTSLEMAIFNHVRLHPGVTKLNISSFNQHLVDPLSEREFEILLSLKDGKSNSQLAETHFLSVNTIKTHLQHIYSKLGVKNRTEAMFKLNSML